MLGFVSLFAGWSLLLAVLGIGALDFTLFGISVASHPEPFVLNGVALAIPVALLVLAPIAALGVVGGIRLWFEWSPPRLALLACVGWLVLGVVILAIGGDWGLIVGATVLIAIIFSGAWARRREGATPLEVFLGRE
jgi:hypothetical protein